MKIQGYVEAVLRDVNGNVVETFEGPNAIVEMSNNILMDLIMPTDYLTSQGAAPGRAEATNMTDNTTFPSGANYIGVDPVNGSTQANLSRNQIAFICVGDNIGTLSDSTPWGQLNQNTDAPNPEQQVSMVDDGFDITSADYCKKISTVTFPTAKSIRFSTTFGTTEGNLADGIAEIALWTTGDAVTNEGGIAGNITTDRPSSSSFCRMFARKVLANTITKTDDGTLDITYTLTFGA